MLLAITVTGLRRHFERNAARAAAIALSLACALLCMGCATAVPRNPVPEALIARAAVLDHEQIRFWGDEPPRDIATALRASGAKGLAEAPRRVQGRPVVEYLALSGGSDHGAFGAGLLAGWTKAGHRPRFEVVTGISAGALIAPFAFLGPDYDQQLKEMWSHYNSNDIFQMQVLTGLLGGSSIADSAPLAALIAKYVDRRFLAAVAREYHKGRLLLVGTTNLDAQRLVVWNMGEIAASGHRDALELFRSVLLASAALPGVFPPVRINVVVDGKTREEMHVDGGIGAQVFLAPIKVSLREVDTLFDKPPIHRIYVIRNARLTPAFNAVDATSFAIAARSLDSIIFSQSKSDVLRIYTLAKQSGADFNLAAIPGTFTMTSKEPFNRELMKALFDLGFVQASTGYSWMKVPPELAP